MKKSIFLLGASFLCAAQMAWSQTPADKHTTLLLSDQDVSVTYADTAFTLRVLANADYTVTSSDDTWAKVQKSEDGKKVQVTVAENLASTGRQARLTFASADGKVTRVFTVNQERENLIATLPTDIKLAIASATASEAQAGNEISKSYDGDYSTIWHTRWGATPTQFPVTATWTLKQAETVDYLVYVPRPAGETNGNFQEVEISYQTEGSTEWKKLGDYNFRGSSASQRVEFSTPLQNAKAFKFVVKSGANNFASCAEMEFYRKNEAATEEFSVFADDTWSSLAPGVDQARIDAMTIPFCKILAQGLLDNTYTTRWRVADYKARLNPAILAERWMCPGKSYDKLDGPTGINISKGKHVVMVSGIPEGETVELEIMAWFAQDLDSKGDGGGPSSQRFGLHNGMNVINYTQEKDGLAYVIYYVNDKPEEKPSVKVHFINGQINGYLHPELSNDEMHELCKNAPNRCIDVYGHKAHTVWEADGMYNYCKDVNNQPKGYRQYMNVIDSLVDWEHHVLGFKKYNHVPDNHTMAYVNYTYYMFQGGLGVSFKYDTQSRVLNCQTLTKRDDDAIWGLSHEWGHQHQMTPFFNWAGLSEVSNNVKSYYNIMKMGYWTSDKINAWPAARGHFILNKVWFKPNGGQSFRREAYENRNRYSWNEKLYALSESMVDSLNFPAAEKDPARAVSISEMSVGEVLCPFIMLQNYAYLTLGKKDFAADMYESLRQTVNMPNGSTVEKQGMDKYEVIAAAQYGNANNALEVLRKNYPNSCWVKDNYINEQHCDWTDNSAPFIFNYIRKVSYLYGYNLFPYFDEWGFMRRIALRIGDYGNKSILITQEMYDEFKADMDQLVKDGKLKAMPEGMVRAISMTRDLNVSETDRTFTTPDFPN